jgi:NifU-like protein involved in Fe-S cluster formation
VELMQDSCSKACCGATLLRTVSELFNRGFQRNRAAPCAIGGMTRSDGDALTACFSLELDGDRLAQIGFRASSCATLIAYCELVAELATGQPLGIAARLTPAQLVAELSGVPLLKQDRAALAVAAFHAALVAAHNHRSAAALQRQSAG